MLQVLLTNKQLLLSHSDCVCCQWNNMWDTFQHCGMTKGNYEVINNSCCLSCLVWQNWWFNSFRKLAKTKGKKVDDIIHLTRGQTQKKLNKTSNLNMISSAVLKYILFTCAIKLNNDTVAELSVNSSDTLGGFLFSSLWKEEIATQPEDSLLKPVLLQITVVTLSQHNCNMTLCVTQTHNAKRHKHSGDFKQ